MRLGVNTKGEKDRITAVATPMVRLLRERTVEWRKTRWENVEEQCVHAVVGDRKEARPRQ